MSKNAQKPHYVIGIDIGGTGIKGGIVNLKKGELVGDRFRIDTPQPSTPQAVAKVVKQIVDELMSRDEAPSAENPVGVDFPAIIAHGVARSAANVDKSWIGAMYLPTKATSTSCAGLCTATSSLSQVVQSTSVNGRSRARTM